MSQPVRLICSILHLKVSNQPPVTVTHQVGRRKCHSLYRQHVHTQAVAQYAKLLVQKKLQQQFLSLMKQKKKHQYENPSSVAQIRQTKTKQEDMSNTSIKAQLTGAAVIASVSRFSSWCGQQQQRWRLLQTLCCAATTSSPLHPSHQTLHTEYIPCAALSPLHSHTTGSKLQPHLPLPDHVIPVVSIDHVTPPASGLVNCGPQQERSLIALHAEHRF